MKPCDFLFVLNASFAMHSHNWSLSPRGAQRAAIAKEYGGRFVQF